MKTSVIIFCLELFGTYAQFSIYGKKIFSEVSYQVFELGKIYRGGLRQAPMRCKGRAASSEINYAIYSVNNETPQKILS